MAFTEEELELLNKTASALKHVPYIYREVILASNTNPSNHYIKHKVGTVDNNSVLFFIPRSYDSRNNNENLQFLKLLQPGSGYSISSSDIVTYKIMIERNLNDGTASVEQAKALHLKPEKLYMLRLLSSTELLIINFNYDDELTVATFTASDAIFLSTPVVEVDGEEIALVKADDFAALVARVTALENKLKVNTQAPEEALQEEAEGTIYFKVDEYGSSED